MGYIAPLFLLIATGYCQGERVDGTKYRDFIPAVQSGYRNLPTWEVEVRRGQSRLCKSPTW